MLHKIETSAGVRELNQPAGLVMVERDQQSTFVALHMEGEGGVATVYLDHRQAGELVL